MAEQPETEEPDLWWKIQDDGTKAWIDDADGNAIELGPVEQVAEAFAQWLAEKDFGE